MTDRTTVNLVIGFLGAIALVLTAGAIFLTFQEKTVPGELWTLAGIAVGAFATLLTRTSSGPGEESTPVTVTNTAAQPVQVEPVGD